MNAIEAIAEMETEANRHEHIRADVPIGNVVYPAEAPRVLIEVTREQWDRWLTALRPAEPPVSEKLSDEILDFIGTNEHGETLAYSTVPTAKLREWASEVSAAPTELRQEPGGRQGGETKVGEKCNQCYTCLKHVTSDAFPGAMRMIVCPQCGNKRCPKATYHGHLCSGSNDPSQPGCRFAASPTSEPAATVEARQPSIDDIDAAFDEIDLTDEQSEALLAQRAAGSAKATVPIRSTAERVAAEMGVNADDMLRKCATAQPTIGDHIKNAWESERQIWLREQQRLTAQIARLKREIEALTYTANSRLEIIEEKRAETMKLRQQVTVLTSELSLSMPDSGLGGKLMNRSEQVQKMLEELVGGVELEKFFKHHIEYREDVIRMRCGKKLMELEAALADARRGHAALVEQLSARAEQVYFVAAKRGDGRTPAIQKAQEDKIFHCWDDADLFREALDIKFIGAKFGVFEASVVVEPLADQLAAGREGGQ